VAAVARRRVADDPVRPPRRRAGAAGRRRRRTARPPRRRRVPTAPPPRRRGRRCGRGLAGRSADGARDRWCGRAAGRERGVVLRAARPQRRGVRARLRGAGRVAVHARPPRAVLGGAGAARDRRALAHVLPRPERGAGPAAVGVGARAGRPARHRGRRRGRGPHVGGDRGARGRAGARRTIRTGGAAAALVRPAAGCHDRTMTSHEASAPVTRMWLALPYALVVAPATLVAVREHPRLPLLLGLCAALLAWHTWWAVLHPGWLESRTVPMLVYFVGLVAASAALFSLSFTFLLVYLVCFALAFVALPGGWAYLGVALTAAAMLGIPGLLTPAVENVVVTLAGGVVAAVAGWSIRAVEDESAGRRAALAELARTNADLERALRRNADLQAELVENAHQRGVARERTRIAAEIHDTLAADLAGVVAQLEALVAEAGPGGAVTDRVERSLALARSALRQARTSVTSMRALEPGDGLAEALDRLVRQHAPTADARLRLVVDGEVTALPDTTADALLRVAGEAVRNALRHADAGTVTVTLSFLGEAVCVDVVDDGRGFDPD